MSSYIEVKELASGTEEPRQTRAWLLTRTIIQFIINLIRESINLLRYL